MTDKGMQLCRNLVSPLVEEKCYEFAMQTCDGYPHKHMISSMFPKQAGDTTHLVPWSLTTMNIVFNHVNITAIMNSVPLESPCVKRYEYCIRSLTHNCNHEISLNFY